MKLLTTALLAGLLLLSTRANAQVKPGFHQVGITLGLANPVTHDDVDGENTEFGALGPAFGLSYLYQLQPYLSFGGDFNYKHLGTKDISTGHGAGEIKSSAWTLLGIGRLDLSPDNQIRPYALLGLGVGRVQRDVEYSANPRFDAFRSSSGIAFALGGGADYDINATWLAGAELRYNIISTSESEVGTSSVSTLDFLLKAGYKF